MADEQNGTAVEGTPAQGSPDTNAQGDISTPAPKLEDTIDGQKIDISKMTQEELKGYKRAQAHFTKFTQTYKTKEDELSGKLKSYESLLGDEMIQPLAHYRTYGRLPDGVDPNAFFSKIQTAMGVNNVQATQQDQNAPYVDENTKAYINSMFQQYIAPLQQKAEAADSFAKGEVQKKASGTIDDFQKELTTKDPKLGELFEKYTQNGQLTQALKNTPFNPDFKARLKFAFNGLTADEYIPEVEKKTRETLLKELQNKNNTERPLNNGSSGGAATTKKTDLRQILSEEFDKIGG